LKKKNFSLFSFFFFFCTAFSRQKVEMDPAKSKFANIILDKISLDTLYGFLALCYDYLVPGVESEVRKLFSVNPLKYYILRSENRLLTKGYQVDAEKGDETERVMIQMHDHLRQYWGQVARATHIHEFCEYWNIDSSTCPIPAEIRKEILCRRDAMRLHPAEALMIEESEALSDFALQHPALDHVWEKVMIDGSGDDSEGGEDDIEIDEDVQPEKKARTEEVVVEGIPVIDEKGREVIDLTKD